VLGIQLAVVNAGSLRWQEELSPEVDTDRSTPVSATEHTTRVSPRCARQSVFTLMACVRTVTNLPARDTHGGDQRGVTGASQLIGQVEVAAEYRSWWRWEGARAGVSSADCGDLMGHPG
jgi:hypothetical protein